MYCLIDMCCICLSTRNCLKYLDCKDSKNVTYLEKLSNSFRNMDFDPTGNAQMICNVCSYKLDMSYDFYRQCLNSRIILRNYMDQIKPADEVCGILEVSIVKIEDPNRSNWKKRKINRNDSNDIKRKKFEYEYLRQIQELKLQNVHVHDKKTGYMESPLKDLQNFVSSVEEKFNKNVIYASDIFDEPEGVGIFRLPPKISNFNRYLDRYDPDNESTEIFDDSDDDSIPFDTNEEMGLQITNVRGNYIENFEVTSNPHDYINGEGDYDNDNEFRVRAGNLEDETNFEDISPQDEIYNGNNVMSNIGKLQNFMSGLVERLDVEKTDKQIEKIIESIETDDNDDKYINNIKKLEEVTNKLFNNNDTFPEFNGIKIPIRPISPFDHTDHRLKRGEYLNVRNVIYGVSEVNRNNLNENIPVIYKIGRNSNFQNLYKSVPNVYKDVTNLNAQDINKNRVVNKRGLNGNARNKFLRNGKQIIWKVKDAGNLPMYVPNVQRNVRNDDRYIQNGDRNMNVGNVQNFVGNVRNVDRNAQNDDRSAQNLERRVYLDRSVQNVDRSIQNVNRSDLVDRNVQNVDRRVLNMEGGVQNIDRSVQNVIRNAQNVTKTIQDINRNIQNPNKCDRNTLGASDVRENVSNVNLKNSELTTPNGNAMNINRNVLKTISRVRSPNMNVVYVVRNGNQIIPIANQNGSNVKQNVPIVDRNVPNTNQNIPAYFVNVNKLPKNVKKNVLDVNDKNGTNVNVSTFPSTSKNVRKPDSNTDKNFMNNMFEPVSKVSGNEVKRTDLKKNDPKVSKPVSNKHKTVLDDNDSNMYKSISNLMKNVSKNQMKTILVVKKLLGQNDVDSTLNKNYCKMLEEYGMNIEQDSDVINETICQNGNEIEKLKELTMNINNDIDIKEESLEGVKTEMDDDETFEDVIDISEDDMDEINLTETDTVDSVTDETNSSEIEVQPDIEFVTVPSTSKESEIFFEENDSENPNITRTRLDFRRACSKKEYKKLERLTKMSRRACEKYLSEIKVTKDNRKVKTQPNSKIEKPPEQSYEALMCNDCGLISKSASELLKHVKYNHNCPPFTCKECKINFNYPEAFQSHIRLHTNEKPFQCLSCNKKFTLITNLKVHLRLHSDFPSFLCTFCGRVFNLGEDSGSDGSNCESCEKIYIKDSQLMVRKFTNRTWNYQCTKCEESFKTKCELINHTLEHQIDYKKCMCKICGWKLNFSYKSEVDAHMKTHCKRLL